MPASVLALANSAYLMRKMSSFSSDIHRNRFHCDLKIKLLRVGGISPISVNGFSQVTDVRTGFSNWLIDSGFGGPGMEVVISGWLVMTLSLPGVTQHSFLAPGSSSLERLLPQH